ncbi:MAG: HAMP domain-containing histidine kinase [Prolixibacteraceae bacterium]|nr:HAMP domain-containing histidine kinase [Prolixibacteraceae bacterium]
MKKIKVTWLIVLMAVSLTGIITLQVLWMKNAMDVRNELFNRSVNEALIKTASRIETLSDAMWVHNIVSPPTAPPVLRRPFPQAGKHFRNLAKGPRLQRYDSLAFKHEPGAYGQKRHNRVQIITHSKKNDSNDIQVEVITLDSVITDWEEKIEHRITLELDSMGLASNDSVFVFQPDLSNKIGNKLQRLKYVAGKMVVESYTGNNIIDIDTSMVRQVLTEELANRDIPIGFDFGVFNNDSLMVVNPDADSLKLAESEYQTKLFPNAIFETNNELAIYFPSKKSFVFKSLVWPSLLSLIFCAFIMAVFGLSISYIINQKKVSEMKSDFINNMTHEFKTPLATISVATDTIINPKIINNPDKVKHFTDVIKKENRRMNSQVETILQIARLDRKDFEFNFRVTDIHEIIEKAVQAIALQVESRNGTIDVELNAANTAVTIDPEHTLHILNNLLDNANKYSDEKPDIAITTRNSERGVWVTVSDKGKGMSKQVQNRIFEKFYRETSGNIHNVKGFGLGLSYVKAVIDANHGEVKVNSEPGKGSTFEVFLPFALT